METETNSSRVCVIVPTLNESKNIDYFLEELFRFAGSRLDLEVRVVDGGSSDGTQERVRDWSKRQPVRLMEHGPAGGLAGAVLAGANATDCDIVVLMDADLSHSPHALLDLVKPIMDGKQDMVIGSRYVPGGRTEGWPFLRKSASRVATWLAWPLADCRDPMSGFFAVRRKFLLGVDPQVGGFKIGLEILARWRGQIRLSEVPITFVNRVHGESKFRLKTVGAFLMRLGSLLKTRYFGRSGP